MRTETNGKRLFYEGKYSKLRDVDDGNQSEKKDIDFEIYIGSVAGEESEEQDSQVLGGYNRPPKKPEWQSGRLM